MRFVFSERVFDTDKATYLAKVRKWYKTSSWIIRKTYGEDVGHEYDCDLYVSEKGRYLISRRSEDGKGYSGQLISEEEARRLLATYAPEVYAEQFGEPEEL